MFLLEKVIKSLFLSTSDAQMVRKAFKLKKKKKNDYSALIKLSVDATITMDLCQVKLSLLNNYWLHTKLCPPLSANERDSCHLTLNSISSVIDCWDSIISSTLHFGFKAIWIWNSSKSNYTFIHFMEN